MEKKMIFLISLVLLISSTSMSCISNDEKIENTEEKISKANQALKKANQAYVTDIENYRKATSKKVAVNEKIIADFKIRITSGKKSANADHQKQVEILEKRNINMKTRLENYKIQGKEEWKTFKAELTRDMDIMENDFKILTVKK